MVGFVAAVIAELTTNQSVWSQLAGKTASNGKVLEHGWQFAPLGFGAVVALLTYASIAPQFQAGELPQRLTASMNSLKISWLDTGIFLSLRHTEPCSGRLSFSICRGFMQCKEGLPSLSCRAQERR